MCKKIILIFLLYILSVFSFSQTILPVFQTPPGDTICINTSAVVNLSASSGDSIQASWGEGGTDTYFPSYGRVGHTYDSLGTFTIIFTAFQGGLTAVDSLHITVVPPPNIDFTYSFTDSCAKANIPVQFTDLSDPGLTNYLWNFGDGTTAGTSTQQNPNYTYAVPSNYVVSLTAQNNICAHTKVKTVELPFDTTLATVIIATDDCPCNKINFSVSGSATSWAWNLGDGNTSALQSFQHTYSEPGNYLVSVTGYDAVSGCEYTISKAIEVCPGDLNIFHSRSNNNWYFYHYNGLTFTTGTPVFTAGGQMNSLPGPAPGEGGATISHPVSGSLLFYTEGQKVWDRNHNVMPAGTGLFGNNSSTESALIIPKPGNIDQYYIFTSSGASSGARGYYYSIVDLSLNAGNGDVTTKNAPLFPKSSFQPEALKGVVKKEAQYCNDAEYWVIVPTAQDTFRSYLVTTAGVAPAVVNSMVSPAIPNMMNRAVMGSAISPNGRMYAIIEGNLTAAKYRIRLMTFNPLTGQLTNQRILNPYLDALYGISFSPDNTKLYAGGDDFIIQYDLTKNYFATFLPVNGLVRTIQIAQNNKVYFITEGSGYLGVINNPDNQGVSCGVNQNGVYLNGNKTMQGLQNFVPLRLTVHDTLDANFTITTGTVCSLDISLNNLSDSLSATDSCSFFANDTASYFWDFGDGTTSTLFQPGSHSFPSPGTYSIKLVVRRLRTCTADSLMQNITVALPPPTTTITVAPACDSVFVGSNWYYNSQTIADTIFAGASNGCDSIINTAITIGYASAITINPLSCGNYNSPAGNVYTTSGMYVDTIANASGCDSIITINLTVVDSVVSTVIASACDSTFINGNWYYASQLVRDTLSGAAQNGCDSIVKTNLTISYSSTTNNVITICQGQSAVIHGNNQNAAGVYSQTFSAANGCDSISSITLSVNLPSVYTQTIVACDSVFVNGNWIFTSQTLNDTLGGASSNGCDSIVNYIVSITSTPGLSVTPMVDTIAIGNTITLSASGALTYLWDDGSTTSTYTVIPIQTTTYCVIGSNNNCPDTVCARVYVVECSSGKLFIPTAFSPNGDGQNDELCVYGTACIKTLQLSIYNRWGELVYESSNPDDCWNGKFRNKQMDGAVFSFSLNAITTANELVLLKGNITLVR